MMLECKLLIMTKYKKFYNDMINNNESLFKEFKTLHDNYVRNSTKWQMEFNEEGKKVLEVIRSYEKMLCSQSESSSYGKYSSNLADKFWAEVRKNFSMIDFVGVK